MDYMLVIHPAEEGGYWAEVPDLDGCFAQGETLDELLEDARQAIVSHLDALRADGRTIAAPRGVLVTSVRVAEPDAA